MVEVISGDVGGFRHLFFGWALEIQELIMLCAMGGMSGTAVFLEVPVPFLSFRC